MGISLFHFHNNFDVVQIFDELGKIEMTVRIKNGGRYHVQIKVVKMRNYARFEIKSLYSFMLADLLLALMFCMTYKDYILQVLLIRKFLFYLNSYSTYYQFVWFSVGFLDLTVEVRFIKPRLQS